VYYGAPGSAVDWGIALQAASLLFRFSMESLKFFIDLSFRSHYGPEVDSASNRKRVRDLPLVVKVAGV
jgi:hypothetical protein